MDPAFVPRSSTNWRSVSTLEAQENSIWRQAPLSKRMKPMARSSTSKTPPASFSPKAASLESTTSESANLQ